MRVAIVTESFLPQVNGVTNSVLRILEHFRDVGVDAMVVAPGPGPDEHAGASIVRVPAVPLPRYRTFPVGVPTRRVAEAVTAFAPDVVHLASPIVLGAAGVAAAKAARVPCVAVYQSDVPGFAARYGFGIAKGPLWRWLRRLHSQTDLTLAPSSATAWELARHGIGPVARWGRGVDSTRFHPAKRSEAFRRHVAPDGEVIVGYVGRLAPEKQVERLVPLAGVRGVRVVVVGDGPSRAGLQRRMPRASFVGFRTGDDLASIVASLDVFVHPGSYETFCQAVQEALAAGVPVVAPAAGGPLDLVRHGENGYLYPAHDPGVIVSAVAALRDDPVRRQAMSSAARAAVADRSWATVVEELLAHYRRVIATVPVSEVRAA